MDSTVPVTWVEKVHEAGKAPAHVKGTGARQKRTVQCRKKCLSWTPQLRIQQGHDVRGAVDDPYPRTVRETCTYVGKNIVDVRNLLGRSETVDVILGSIESQYIASAVA